MSLAIMPLTAAGRVCSPGRERARAVEVPRGYMLNLAGSGAILRARCKYVTFPTPNAPGKARGT